MTDDDDLDDDLDDDGPCTCRDCARETAQARVAVLEKALKAAADLRRLETHCDECGDPLDGACRWCAE